MLQIFGHSIGKASRITQVGFVSADPAPAQRLAACIPQRDGIEIVALESASILADAPIPGVGVFLYDLDISSEASIAEFDRFMLARPASIPVIVLSAAIDEELVRWFLRLRVSDWLKVPLAAGELITASGRALSQASAGRTEVQCTAFINARGGAGATTAAIHAALIAARKFPAPGSTLLVDLNLSNGCCADYLDLQPGWQVDELVHDPGRLDRHMLEIMTARHKTGIDVLAAQRAFFAPPIASQEVITSVLDLATRTHQQLVIDMPRQAESWTEAVLLGSSAVYIVTDFSIVGLKSAKRLAADMLQAYGGELKPRVIINKYRRSMFASALSSHEVKKVLGDLVAGYVPSEESLLREAADRGVPTTEIKPKNAVINELAKILGAA